MKRMLKLVAVVGWVFGLGPGFSACGANEPQDIMDIIMAASPGRTRAAVASERVSGGAVGKQYATGYGPDRCFDGIKFSGNNADRFLGQIVATADDGTGGTYVQLDVSGGNDLPVCYLLSSYELHRLSTGWNSRDRAPTAWKLEGSMDGVSWQTIDERTGVVWGGSQEDEGSNPVEKDCHQAFEVPERGQIVPCNRIRFTPLASNFSGSWDVGLDEIVYKAIPGGLLTVYHGDEVLGGAGTFSHANGEVIAGVTATVTAPETVVKDGIVYRCVGSVYSTPSEGTSVTNIGNSCSCDLNNKAHTLTWLWELTCTSDPVTLQRLARATGSAWTASGTGAAGYGPEKAFDGVTGSDNEKDRWVCDLNASAVLAQRTVSGEWLKLSPKLVAYRLYQHTVGYSCNSRAPTAWKVEGSVDGTTWETIETVTDFTWVSQGGAEKYHTGASNEETSPYALGEPEDGIVTRHVTTDKSYVAYRFVPTASLLTGANAAGLMEVEFLLEANAERPPLLYVRGNRNVPGVAPDYGTHRAEERVTCTAPEIGFLNETAYRCTGYTKETKPFGAIAWGDPVRSSERTFEYVCSADEDVRITWQWEPVGARLAVTPRFGGLETFTYDTADYLNPDEPNAGYYKYNTTATVTVHPATDPVSIFTGEVFGDVAGVTVAGNVLTVPVGTAPRAFEAGFDRHWKWSPGRSATAELSAIDYVTDGNWTIALSPQPYAVTVYGPYECYRLAQFEADGVKAHVGGRGTLDLTHLNADLAAQGRMPLIRLTAHSFMEVAELTELIMPADITSGHSDPFTKCPNLKRVVWNADGEYMEVMPQDVNVWGCFQDCTALETVIATNLTRLPPRFFKGCTSLSNVVFSTRLRQVGQWAFEGCTGFAGQTLVVPGSVTNFALNTADPPRANTFYGAKFDTLDLSRLKMSALPPGTLDGCEFKRVIFNRTMKELPYPNVPDAVGAQLRRYVFRSTPPTEFATGDRLWTCGIVAPMNLISEWKKDSRFIPFEDCVTNEALKARTAIYNYFIRDKSDPTCVGGWNNELLFTGESVSTGLVFFVN